MIGLAGALGGGAGRAEGQATTDNAFGFRWHETGLSNHPLVGRVWSANAGALVDPATLDKALPDTDFLLLGEVHDNADAHALQGWAIRRRTRGERAPGVVFEHIRTDQVDALARFEEFGRESRRLPTPQDLFRFLDWKTSGWPSEDKFLPLFAAVFDPPLPIYAANPPRAQVRAIARGEATQLSAEDRARLQLDVPLEPPLAAALRAELEGSHCGMMPASAVPSISVAQRYRDAMFADAMLRVAASDGASILAAGSGHVRTDRAVPWYLHRRAPDRRVIAIMMLEVEADKRDPAAYAPRDPAGKPAVDYIIFTPRAQRADPCETMRQQKEKKG